MKNLRPILCTTVLAFGIAPAAHAQEFGYGLGLDLNGLILPSGPAGVTQLEGGLGFVRDRGVPATYKRQMGPALQDAWGALPPRLRAELGPTEFELETLHDSGSLDVQAVFRTDSEEIELYAFGGVIDWSKRAEAVSAILHEIGHKHAARMAAKGQDPTLDPTFQKLAKEEGLLDVMRGSASDSLWRLRHEVYAEMFRRTALGIVPGQAAPVTGYTRQTVRAKKTQAYVHKKYLDEIDLEGLNLEIDLSLTVPSINLGSLTGGMDFVFVDVGFGGGFGTPVVTITEIGPGGGGM